jgi:hypothetical protein
MSDEDQEKGTGSEIPPAAPSPPLLNVELGANSGTFAPLTTDDAFGWIAIELEFWSWLPCAGVMAIV